MFKRKIKTFPYDSANYLKSDEEISLYMQEAFKTDDPSFIAFALGTIARARGMAKVAERSGLSRESLYKTLSGDGNPEFATILKLMPALGLKLSISTASTTS
jgi:probable addiction module antidote protein